jgi:anti-sigma factor ChrR (cupin superfamily)
VKQTAAAVLDHDAIEALSQELRPIEPHAGRDPLRVRILARIREPSRASELLTVTETQGEWETLLPLVRRKKLFSNDAGEAFVYHLAPGARLPPHPHASDEECMLLDGEVMIGDMRMQRGDFQLAPKGVRHTEIYTHGGAILYIRTGRGG